MGSDGSVSQNRLFHARSSRPSRIAPIAITDYSFANLDVEEGILRPLGHEIAAWKEKRPAAELTQLVADADAVITQFAPVNADVIASMRQAKVIVRYGIGVDNGRIQV